MTTVSKSATTGPTLGTRADAAALASPHGRAIRRIVLLAGATRQPQLRRATGRIPAALPLTHEQSVLDQWLDETDQLARANDLDAIDARLMIDVAAPKMNFDRDMGRVALTVLRDPDQYRGTGGLLRDVAEDLENDDWMFVASAGQILFQPLRDIFEHIDNTTGDVVVATNQDGSPSGFLLVRCGVLRAINRVGFVDMKEQALPAIAKAHRVSVAVFEQAPAMTIRERPQYLTALRRYHQLQAGLPAYDPYEERWSPAFRICEDGASVAGNAIVQDSVALSGARVESGAVVVRSVICAGAVVKRKQRIIDRIIGAAE